MLGIIGAMDEEVNRLKGLVDSPVVSRFGSVDFVSGNIENKRVCVAQCNPGKVNAALCAQLMLDKFGVDEIINIGIGCSLSDKVEIKNVVIASDVCQYDIDTTGCGDPPGFISGLNVIKISTDKTLSEGLLRSAEKISGSVFCGTIASGDTFIASTQLKEKIAADFGAICGEMEGGAIGQVCLAGGIPFAVLRCISDGGDEGAQIDYPTFKKIAADISTAIITDYIKG